MNNNYRLTFKNNTKNDLRYNKKLLENSEKTLNNLRAQKANSFTLKKVEKLEIDIAKYKQEIKKLEEKVNLIDKGKYDDEIEKIVQKQAKEAELKNRAKSQKKKAVQKVKAERSKISKDYYEKNRQAMRANRYQDRGVKSSYRFYCKVADQFPDYLKKNLSNMPCNKGYFWKGVAFYGYKKQEKNKPTVLFERKRDGSMIIHEWTPTHYNQFKKKDKKSRKELFSSKRRRVIN